MNLLSPHFSIDRPRDDVLQHHGIIGQKWGQRRFQYDDGSLTPEGRIRYGRGSGESRSKAGSGRVISGKGTNLAERVKNMMDTADQKKLMNSIRNGKDVSGNKKVKEAVLSMKDTSTEALVDNMIREMWWSDVNTNLFGNKETLNEYLDIAVKNKQKEDSFYKQYTADEMKQHYLNGDWDMADSGVREAYIKNSKSPDVIGFKDADKRFVKSNEKIEKAAREKAKEILGDSASEVIGEFKNPITGKVTKYTMEDKLTEQIANGAKVPFKAHYSNGESRVIYGGSKRLRGGLNPLAVALATGFGLEAARNIDKINKSITDNKKAQVEKVIKDASNNAENAEAQKRFEKMHDNYSKYGMNLPDGDQFSTAEKELKSKKYDLKKFDTIKDNVIKETGVYEKYAKQQEALDKRNNNKNPFKADKLYKELEKARAEASDANTKTNALLMKEMGKYIDSLPKEDQAAAYTYVYCLLDYDW